MAGVLALETQKKSGLSANRVFFGWWIVGAAIAIQFLHGGLLFSAFGAYFVRLQEEFGWTRATLSWSFSLLRVESGLLGPVQGWLIDKFGSRSVLAVGLVIYAGGFMLLSRVDSLLGFYLVFLVIAIGSSLGGFLTLFVTVANWFRRHRSTALGLSQTGASIGGMAVPLVAWSLVTHGWRDTAFFSGIVILVVGMPLVPLFRSRPESYGMLPDGGARQTARTETAPAALDEGRDFTVREALRTPAFWFISLGHGSALFVVGALMVHLIPHLVQKLEVSLESAAAVVAAITATQIIGQVSGGFLGDRMDKRLISAVCMLGHGVALMGIAYAGSLGLVYVFAVIHGLAWGTRGPLMGAMRADYFGVRALGTIMGLSSLIVTVGNVFGPVFAGFMADVRGDYELGFVILAAMTGVGTVFFLAAKRPSPPVSDWARRRRLAMERRTREQSSSGGSQGRTP